MSAKPKLNKDELDGVVFRDDDAADRFINNLTHESAHQSTPPLTAPSRDPYDPTTPDMTPEQRRVALEIRDAAYNSKLEKRAEYLTQFNLPRVTLAMAAIRPELDFVMPGLLRGSVGMIVGQGAIGKSFLAIQIAVDVVSGKPIAGGLWEAQKQGSVLLIMGEDDTTILQERLYWVLKNTQLTSTQQAEAERLIDIRSARGFDIRLMEKTNNGFKKCDFFFALMEMCRGRRLVIIDPLLFLNGGDENDNGAASILMSNLYEITRETGCTIIILHHVSKSGGGAKGEEWELARGASAFTTSVRWQVNMTMLSPSQLTDAGIPQDMRNQWVRLATVKSNYGPATSPSLLKRLVGGVLKLTDPSEKEKTEKAYVQQSQPADARAGAEQTETAKGGKKNAFTS